MKKDVVMAIMAGLAAMGLLWAIAKIQVSLTSGVSCNCGEVGIYEEAELRYL